MTELDSIPGPDELELVDDDGPRDAGPHETSEGPTEPVSDAERSFTDAVTELRRRGQRVVRGVEHVITPRHVAIGVSAVVGVGVVLAVAGSRRRRRSGTTSLASLIARSIAREVVGRIVLGAAAAAGARIAEAAIPLIIAAVSARLARPRPARRQRVAATRD